MATVQREYASPSRKPKASTKTTGAKKRVKKPRAGFLGSEADAAASTKNHGVTLLVFGPEGVGKSSLFGYADDVVFVVGRAEQGIRKLKRARLVPSSVAVPRDVTNWYDLLQSLDELAELDHDYQFVALDSLTIFQQMCFETCCREMYDDDYSKDGFLAFQQGPRTAALHYWPELLSRLDILRECGMHIGLTAHSNIKPYKNPNGPDFDRFVADLSEPIWKATARWCDAVLFLNHSTDVGKDGKYAKYKGSGGEQRIIATEYCATYDAKNRFKLPTIMGPYDDAKTTWDGLWGRIHRALNPVKKKMAS